MEKQEINYPWDWAPDWAQYAAVDEDGDAYWFEIEPIIIQFVWAAYDGRSEQFEGFNLENNWTKSLQKRPTIDGINYPWDWAPKWANYAVILSNGDAYWLEQQPTLIYSNWSVTEGRALPIGECRNPKHVENYEHSLQKRPAK